LYYSYLIQNTITNYLPGQRKTIVAHIKVTAA
jgi:hypothetical protein